MGGKRHKVTKDTLLDFDFSTHDVILDKQILSKIIFQRDAPIVATRRILKDDKSSFATDSVRVPVLDDCAIGAPGLFNAPYQISNALLQWYASQSFIGYQLCGVLAQNWLIYKACAMPGQDAIRNWFRPTINLDADVDPKILYDINQSYKKYKLRKHLLEFITKNRIFGVRFILFKVKSKDKKYYEKPFNIDSVTPGSFQGMVQIDPYWIAPELDLEATADPLSEDFYEPTWWMVGGANARRIHKSHIVIIRNDFLPDNLLPTYYYGGMSIPQKVYERVYAAERTANEAPLLALTKRLEVLKLDTRQAVAQQVSVQNRLENHVKLKTNYATRVIGLNEDLLQFDTSLADLDALIATQYAIVAAASDVPVVKLMGTPPKGFNSAGVHEEKSYHEFLKSLQENCLTEVVDRYHEILLRSDIYPKYGDGFEIDVVWNPVSQMSALELAQVNKLKAETGAILINDGSASSEMELNRVINDPESGYSGMEEPDEEEVGVSPEPIEEETTRDFER